jgi:hypothetical protein
VCHVHLRLQPSMTDTSVQTSATTRHVPVLAAVCGAAICRQQRSGERMMMWRKVVGGGWWEVDGGLGRYAHLFAVLRNWRCLLSQVRAKRRRYLFVPKATPIHMHSIYVLPACQYTGGSTQYVTGGATQYVGSQQYAGPTSAMSSGSFNYGERCLFVASTTERRNPD